MGLTPKKTNAQDRRSLEKKRIEINALIDKADQQLNIKGKEERATLKDIRILDKKMEHRETALKNISDQLSLATLEMDKNSVLNSKLNAELDTMLLRYNALLNSAFRQQLSYNKWAFILNANSINDSFQKWRYVQEYERHCQEALAMIKGFQQEVVSSNKELENLVAEKRILLNEAKNQREKLTIEKEKKSELLESVRNDKAAIQEELKIQNALREELNQSIEAAIFAALRGEKIIIETDFSAIKGQLPWPVDNGRVISGFGKQRHKHLKDVMIQNNGIDIQTSIGSVAYIVHSGKVVSIAEIPGYQWTVIVQHGNFYTVYSRLEKVFLQQGQQVSQGERVGMIFLDESGSTEVHFEIWEGKEKLNPSSWLKSDI